MDQVSFELTYAALKMFGKQLYSNAGSAISELVANGIDAKAPEIYVAIDITDKTHATVEIFDTGKGMSPTDIKEKYIKIGYNKRIQPDSSRNQMLGRKGIGKLAALYLSDCFTIATKQKDNEMSVWSLDVSSTADNQTPQLLQRPNEIPNNLVCYQNFTSAPEGTLIYLQNVDFKQMGDRAFEALESKLSNFFLYDELGTKILINIFNKPESKGIFKPIQKRIAFKNMVTIYTDDPEIFHEHTTSEYVVAYKDKLGAEKLYRANTAVKSFGSVLFANDISGTYQGVPYTLKGWIGIHSSIDKEAATRNDDRYIKNQYYNPNQLRIYVRNKLGLANMLEHLGITRAFGNYIEGEIIFDILDDDQLDDIATAGRQDFDTQDDRFVKLKNMMTKLGNALVADRQNLANRINSEKKKDDISISSKAKKIFQEELHQELEPLMDVKRDTKAHIEAIISSKLEGDSKISAKAQYTIFLSHASKDKMISDCIYHYLKAKKFNGDLEDENCEIFYSSSGLDTDNLEPLSKLIRDAIISKNNDILFLTSKNFNNSPFCLFEGGAAWATRSIGEFKVLSLTYDEIPVFLTNGKSEVVLGIKNAADFDLDSLKYKNIIAVINRLIKHLNKNREVAGTEQVALLPDVIFPNMVELKRVGKTEKDYMDSEFLEYWNTYVVSQADQYVRDNQDTTTSPIPSPIV